MPSTKPTHFADPIRNVIAIGIEPGMNVADFGAGSGAYTLAIAEALDSSGHIYAIDVQKDLLRRIKNEADRKMYRNVEIIWADLEEPRSSKVADRSIDVVLASNILFQLPDKKPIFTEAARILKPRGKLVIIDWSESFGGMGPVKEDVVSKESALAIAKDAGFALSREFAAGAHHYGLIFHPPHL